MPVTRSQSRAASSVPGSSASSQPSILQENLQASSGVSSSAQAVINYPDEHSRLFHKLTKNLDLFQPTYLRPDQLEHAKYGVFPHHLDHLTRIKTQSYMTWANAVALVALQNEDALNIMANAVADPMPALEELRNQVRDVLDDYSRNPGRTYAETQVADDKLEDALNDLMNQTDSISNEHPMNSDAWEFAVGILILIMEDLCDQVPSRQTTLDTHLGLMDTAMDKISSDKVRDTLRRAELA